VRAWQPLNRLLQRPSQGFEFFQPRLRMQRSLGQTQSSSDTIAPHL